jgi:DNA-binding NtrC family response regulator
MKDTVSILVVDDDLAMSNLLGKLLAREGYQIVEAGGGDAALKILQSREIDIVVSDAKMPGMDGFELLRQVKRMRPEIGYIIMTAHGDVYSVKDALSLGADEYITKPFNSHEISLVVERVYWRLLSADSHSEKPV